MSLALATVSMVEETVGHNMLLGSSSSSSSCSGSSSSDDSMMVDEAINTLLQRAARALVDIESGIEDRTINWRKHGGLLIQEY